MKYARQIAGGAAVLSVGAGLLWWTASEIPGGTARGEDHDANVMVAAWDSNGRLRRQRGARADLVQGAAKAKRAPGAGAGPKTWGVGEALADRTSAGAGQDTAGQIEVREGVPESMAPDGSAAWDEMSTGERKAFVRRDVLGFINNADTLERGAGLEQRRSEAAQVLAAARGDFFIDPKGRAEYLTLEAKIEDARR